jgi:alpha-beta hydrolase superfamily lysophospholipase
MPFERAEGILAQRTVPGPALYFMSCVPSGGAKATVGILHGYAEHAARYTHVMEAWAEAGMASVAIDLRGHGRAAGVRGHCDRFDEYLDDAAELAALVRAKASGGSCFLFGHSMGGLVASLSAIESPGGWRGLVLSAPFMGLALDVPKLKVMAGRVAAVLAPRLALPSGLSGADVTRDAARAAAYDNDPLVFKKATARWFRESQKAQARALARAGELRMPLFEAFGTADHVAKLAAGKAFFDHAGSEDKTWEPCEGAFHEVLNEPEWRPLADKMAKWMLSRVAGA